MPHKIDSIDRAIVACLMKDGQMTCREIANSIGNITERAVRYRLDRLTRQRLIRVTAVVDAEAIGFPVAADVWVEVEPGRIKEVAQHMCAMEEISYLACSTGENDISMQVRARSNSELYTFVTEVLGKIPGVKKTTTILVPVILKDNYDWGIPLSACVDGKEGSRVNAR